MKRLSLSFTKNVNLVFNRKTLKDNHVKIKEDMAKFLNDTKSETEMVLGDHSARGKLIQSVDVFAMFNADKKKWNVHDYPLWCKVEEDDAPEYWGNMDVYYSDMIPSIHKYPWMATYVSSKKEPF